MIRPLIVGNWKMHKTVKEATEFIRLLKIRVSDGGERAVAVAPPFTCLYPLSQELKGSGISLAAQNVHDREEGAFTGEVSPRMLVDSGCEFVILGHSERRSFFGEGDDWINRKIRAVLKYPLRPIFCIGETLKEREGHETFAVLDKQLQGGLNGIALADAARVVLAYEPVWAIGTGKTATPGQAAEVHVFIRDMMARKFGEDAARKVPVLYGGSVNPANIEALMAEKEINGALVGGASLDVDAFVRIIGV